MRFLDGFVSLDGREKVPLSALLWSGVFYLSQPALQLKSSVLGIGLVPLWMSFDTFNLYSNLI